MESQLKDRTRKSKSPSRHRASSLPTSSSNGNSPKSSSPTMRLKPEGRQQESRLELGVQEGEVGTPLHNDDGHTTASNPSHLSVFRWGIDLVLWFLMFYRDYSPLTKYNCTISHFVFVLPPSDFGIWFVSQKYRHVLDIFRLTGSFQVGALCFNLLWSGLDGPNFILSVLRIVFCIVRAVHASLALYQNYSLLSEPLRRVGKVMLSSAKDVFFDLIGPVLIFLFLPNYARSTHSCFGETRLEPILTAFQAGDAFNLCVKMYVLDRLMPTNRDRALYYFIMFLSLAVQWPFMFDLYSTAPLPFVHIVAELGLLSSAWSRWRS